MRTRISVRTTHNVIYSEDGGRGGLGAGGRLIAPVDASEIDMLRIGIFHVHYDRHGFTDLSLIDGLRGFYGRLRVDGFLRPVKIAAVPYLRTDAAGAFGQS
ncbi:MAG: hypothetical protein QOK28_925 [Actinomycetota bacterium]